MTNVVAQTGTITINDTSRYIIFVRSGFSFNPTSFNLIALQFPQIIPQIAIGERNYFNIKTLYDEGNYSSIAEIFVQSFQMLFNNYTYGFHTDMPFTYPHNEHFLYCLLYTSPSPRDLSTSRMPSSA